MTSSSQKAGQYPMRNASTKKGLSKQRDKTTQRQTGMRPRYSTASENSEGDSEISERCTISQHTARVLPFCYRADLSVISLSRGIELELARLLRTISKLTRWKKIVPTPVQGGSTHGLSRQWTRPGYQIRFACLVKMSLGFERVSVRRFV